MSDSSGHTRVLILAEAANPEWVSVPLVGWSLARALSRKAEVHIVTQSRNRDAFLRAGLQEGQDFTAVDSESIARPLWRLATILAGGGGQGWTIQQAVNLIAYPYFEYLVWKRFHQRIKRGDFDVVHRMTPLSPVLPSPMAEKCRKAGVPFVLGPLNGGVPWPEGFEQEMKREKEWLSRLRGARRWVPWRKGTMRADAILAGSQQALFDLPTRARQRAIYLPENGVDPARFSQLAQHDNALFRACFIGRLVPLKGVDMLLTAAAPLLRAGRMAIDIIGDGPSMAELKRQASELPGVHFHGWKPHNEVQAIASQCSVLAFPSIREFGGGAVLEAMALGLCPVVLDYAGPSELVTRETGYKVPMGSRNEVVAALGEQLTHCADHPLEVRAKGLKARERVRTLFTWEVKASQVMQVYDWVLNRRKDKPSFFPLPADG